MFISLSLFRYFSLSLHLSVSLSHSFSLSCCVVIRLYFYAISFACRAAFAFVLPTAHFPRVFHLPMRRRRVVPKIVYCVCSAFFSFFFWALPSQSPVNRITELGLQAHKHACKFQGLSICLSACLCLIYCFQAIFISMYFSRKRIALSVRLCPCFVCMFQA